MTEEPTPTPENAQEPEVSSPVEASADTVASESTPVASTSSAQAAKLAPGTFIWGLGRRKASVARVRIRQGDGKFQINKREADEYFKLDTQRQVIARPLVVAEAVKAFDVFVNVRGGGITGQAGAISLGLARALIKADPAFETKLRDQDLLSRDPRRVERKKYGQRGARRRFQFSKR